MKLKPWYQVIQPREDLRKKQALDALEFAVHLDQIREGKAREDYQNPERFFERTYLTRTLRDLGAQVVRRLSGQTLETSAVGLRRVRFCSLFFTRITNAPINLHRTEEQRTKSDPAKPS